MASVSNSEEGEPVFQIAPMIDILLVLLVFFMAISSAEVLQQSRDVNLPVATEAKKPVSHGAQAIVNVLFSPVSGATTLQVDEQTMTNETLVTHLKARLAAVPQTRVLMRADREVRYDFLRSLLDAIGRAGISDITFSVVDRADAPNP